MYTHRDRLQCITKVFPPVSNDLLLLSWRIRICETESFVCRMFGWVGRFWWKNVYLSFPTLHTISEIASTRITAYNSGIMCIVTSYFVHYVHSASFIFSHVSLYGRICIVVLWITYSACICFGILSKISTHTHVTCFNVPFLLEQSNACCHHSNWI